MPLPRFVLVLLTPAVLLVLGTIGYRLIEGWSLPDALYMTVIVITTVGFGEVHPLSGAGRIFTGALALLGVFTAFFAASEVIRSIVGGELRGIIGRQKMERSLAALEDHIIICGFGRVGHHTARELSDAGARFVVVDRDPERLAGFDLRHGLPLQGDATSDDVLRRAGIARARALLAVVGSDADNLYITMSARFLNERCVIAARAEDLGSEEKLVRAGANRVISPHALGGHRIAQAVLRPAVVDFIELATRKQRHELQIEEIRVAVGSALAGTTLGGGQPLETLGIVILAVKRPSGEMVLKPPAETVLASGDVLVAAGKRDQLDRCEERARA